MFFNTLRSRESKVMFPIRVLFSFPVRMLRPFLSHDIFSFPVLQLGISSHENATPVKLIHNSAGHLNGPARTIGASLIGYLGESRCLFLSGFFVLVV